MGTAGQGAGPELEDLAWRPGPPLWSRSRRKHKGRSCRFGRSCLVNQHVVESSLVSSGIENVQ